MKREGTFCDKREFEGRNAPLCPNIAVGQCIGCDQDCCAKHGSSEGIKLVLHRAVLGTTSHDQLAIGTVTVCGVCITKLTQKPALFSDTILPALLGNISEAVKAALAAEALK